MKKFFLFIITALTTSVALAQYKPVDQGSSLQFNIKNFGFTVNGIHQTYGDISFSALKIRLLVFLMSA